MVINRRTFLASVSSAAFLSACGKKAELVAPEELTELALRELYAQDFLVGNIITAPQLAAADKRIMGLLAGEFNALTTENAMKWERLRPGLNDWNWEPVDQFLSFCEMHNMKAIGHVLVWHSQTPDWVFQDEEGQPLGRAGLLARMIGHIQTVAGRCRGKMHAWDVVNEAIEDDGSWRESPWKQQIGSDYIAQAFAAAHAADPQAQLIYNDYNMHAPGKRAAVVAMIRDLKAKGIPIHGVGMQGHIGLDYPSLGAFEASIRAYAAEGVDVHISEVDIDVLPNPYAGADVSTRLDYAPWKDPYKDGLPDDVAEAQAARAEALFAILLRHRQHIARVSFWGLADGFSWKNDFPIPGRTNYPLLWDRNLKPKPVLDRLKQLKTG